MADWKVVAQDPSGKPEIVQLDGAGRGIASAELIHLGDLTEAAQRFFPGDAGNKVRLLIMAGADGLDIRMGRPL